MRKLQKPFVLSWPWAGSLQLGGHLETSPTLFRTRHGANTTGIGSEQHHCRIPCRKHCRPGHANIRSWFRHAQGLFPRSFCVQSVARGRVQSLDRASLGPLLPIPACARQFLRAHAVSPSGDSASCLYLRDSQNVHIARTRNHANKLRRCCERENEHVRAR